MDDRMLEILTSRMLVDSGSKCKACALPTELNARHPTFLSQDTSPRLIRELRLAWLVWYICLLLRKVSKRKGGNRMMT